MPGWSSKLLAAPPRAQPTSNNHRNKQLPRAPQQEFIDVPTLNPERNAPPPQSATSAPRQHAHTHNRSASNPLPKLFGRKKSNSNFHDRDLPPDDGLVPVLDEGQPPSRVISGKKAKVDEDGKITRRCMCCDSTVKVPRELDKFRCLCCLTINDLKPAEQQADSEKDKPQAKRAGTYPGHRNGARPPLSIHHTRALIDKCVLSYLEARCKRQVDAVPGKGKAAVERDEVFESEEWWAKLPLSTPEQEHTARRLQDAPVSTSPPDTPRDTSTAAPANANARDFNELNHPSGNRTDPPPQYSVVPQSPPAGPSSSLARKPVGAPAKPTRKPPPPPMTIANRRPSHNLLPPAGGQVPNGPNSPRQAMSPRLTATEMHQRRHADRIKAIFRPLEDYLASDFGSYHCLNRSFSTVRQTINGRTRSESNIKTPPPELAAEHQPNSFGDLSELDAKTLLLGDIGENGMWWTGRLDRNQSDTTTKRKKVGEGPKKAVSSRTPNLNWVEVATWYDLIHKAGSNWKAKAAESLQSSESNFDKTRIEGDVNIEEIEEDLAGAREHAVRTLLKITENCLKRPTRPIKEPEDLRWLLILLSNPSLYPGNKPYRVPSDRSRLTNRPPSGRQSNKLQTSPLQTASKKPTTREGSQHNGLLKRIFGILAHSSESCHRYLVNWFARFDEDHFVRTVDLVASFVTYRLARQSSGRSRRRSDALHDGGLIPDLSGSAMNTSAQLHSAMGLSGSVKKSGTDANGEPDWSTDWQIKAAAKVMSLMFSANNVWQGKLRETAYRANSVVPSNGSVAGAAARRSGQLLHTSSFYNTLLDYQDMIADFKIWESRRDKFAFCQYPLFLSMGTKIKILEYDARRQMELKAREAYFDQVIRQRAIDGNFHLRVRRECMVDDSLRQISEAVGAGQEELKKGLRVHFTGEEGVDAGGPRKEWFLMIVRDIFDPNHGMFVYDDESNTCYFNTNSFETSDQYYLVGALLGLAIYNSTILDVAFPPFAFRKLLAAAPSSITNHSNVSSLTGTKGQMTYTLGDLAEFRPSLASGLQQLLDFDGDVEATYCRDFVASIDRYGVITDVPLIPNGEKTPVTNANRHEFVDAYVRYLLDTAVSRQFEPFKRGFFTVCAGNALSLFRAEEIELLIRGSDESLDVDSLRAVAQYENWRHFQPPHQQIPNPAESVPVIGWFWELFAEATPERQRKLLTFITGTDRIPAVGATSLVLKIVAGGDGWGGGGDEERGRFPVARTCFNMVVLWRYDYREQLEAKLWRAVEESEGFGLK